MKTRSLITLLTILAAIFTTTSWGEQQAPYGKASVEHINYAPQKVVYDVSTSNLDAFSHVLDRVSYLNTIYKADPFAQSIVMVLHGDEIPYFAISNIEKYKELMRRAKSLTQSGPIEFRMCQVAAQGHGLEADEIHGFVKVVPMADAEIIRLQQEENYAYMR